MHMHAIHIYTHSDIHGKVLGILKVETFFKIYIKQHLLSIISISFLPWIFLPFCLNYEDSISLDGGVSDHSEVLQKEDSGSLSPKGKCIHG